MVFTSPLFIVIVPSVVSASEDMIILPLSSMVALPSEPIAALLRKLYAYKLPALAVAP